MTQKSHLADTLVVGTEIKSEPKELENTAYCANCNVPLNGPFCHSCGQSSKSMIKFFGEVAKELLDDALGYDSRMKHSIIPLLLKPGRITLDYVKGKRFYYVLPFKLYLITSVLFILLIKLTANTDELQFGNIETENSQQIKQETKKETIAEVDEVIANINKNNSNEWIPKINFNKGSKAVGKDTNEKQDNSENTEIVQNDLVEDENEFDLSWNDESKQLTGVEQLEDGWPKRFLTVINPKIKSWQQDTEPLVSEVIELLPYMMFVILPFFAIFLKIFFIFSKRYYTEHLVFLLHNHSFVYLMLMIQMVLGVSYKKLQLLKHWSAPIAAEAVDWLSTIISIWIVVYVFLAMKRFYYQGWGMTVTKTITLSFIYFLMLSIGFVITIAYSAYQA